MQSLITILTSLGFSENEARVYVATYSCGESSPGTIAKESGLNRVTVYEILKRLTKNGIASTTDGVRGKVFSVISPDRLFQRLKYSMEEFQSNMKKFLELKYTHSHKQPKVMFYEGVDGLKEVYEDFCSKPNTEAYTITNPEALYEALGKKYLSSVYRKRKKIGVTVRSLSPDSADGVRAKNNDETAGRKTRLFPNKKYSMSNEIIIYGDRVALMSVSEKISVIIENKEIANSMKNMWKMAWDRFKK